MIIPRFLTELVLTMLFFPILILLSPAILSCCLVPNNTFCLFSILFFIRLVHIYFHMLAMQFQSLLRHSAFTPRMAGLKLR